MKKELKDAIVGALTKKLDEIAGEVVKTIKTDNSTEKPGDKANEGQSADVTAIVKSLNDLKAEIAKLQKDAETTEEKTETTEETTEESTEETTETTEEKTEGEITKKQKEIKASMVELVKSMGIDPKNVDIDFTIKEKKKGVHSDDNSFIKKNKNEDDEIDTETEGELEKAISGLDAEGKKEALDVYFKSMIFGK